MRGIFKIVTEDMNAELTKVFTRDKVTKALQQLHPTEAPRPDGMSAIFFHKHWDIIGLSITNMVLNVLNSNMPMTKINKTNIALIPKTNRPSKMVEFRPISLCNTTYKLISKVLANRLKPILPSIITENQSAFIPNRLILDNVLVAFEFMHDLNHKVEGMDNYMSIKLDMSKAFDKDECNFIKKVMEKMGFAKKWVDLIMLCISSMSYSIIVNGEACGNISPSRGIRQGDPLSPYLFLLSAEGFSALIHKAARDNQIRGMSIGRGCPKITHLLFADDSLFFAKQRSLSVRSLLTSLIVMKRLRSKKLTPISLLFFSTQTLLKRERKEF